MIAPMQALALATVAALFKQPVHDEGVEDEDDARDGLPQMHDGVFVVVAAAALRSVRVLVFVMAQKRCDLHTNLRFMIYDLRTRFSLPLQSEMLSRFDRTFILRTRRAGFWLRRLPVQQ